MNRDAMLARARDRRDAFDLVVVGGGATGLGVATDAAARGYAVLLLERADFGKGTSSRSTKLVHGGVRYLERGDVALVREALVERGLLRANAPHLVSDLPFVVPSYRFGETALFGTVLKAYALLAGSRSFGPSSYLGREEVLKLQPAVRAGGLRGGASFHDGIFDDARFLVHLARTAADRGAVILNYAPVCAVTRDTAGRVSGVAWRDLEGGEEHRTAARTVVNAAGPFCDEVRRLLDPGAAPLLAHSRGIHLVLDGSALPGPAAVVVPRTSDRRILFAVPWHGRALVGTTDTPVDLPAEEPRADDAEIAFVLETAGRYLERPPVLADVRCVFAGLRPLIRRRAVRNTAALSRDHVLHVDAGGLLTITGGKWTTYRNMAEDAVNQAAAIAGLPARPCPTRALRLHGAPAAGRTPAADGPLAVHGTDAARIEALARERPELAARLHPALPYLAAEVVWAAREEMARTLEDVLARRTRALFLDARAAIEAAPAAAVLLARELERDDGWAARECAGFREVARGYVPR